MGGGGGKVLGSITGANKAAKGAAAAAQGAAEEQLRQADKAYQSYANFVLPATTSALAQFDQSIAAQERNLARQEQMAAQIDPTIIEASQQALKLLRGEESSTLAPVKAQRQQQRQALLNSLREQLGPGAETSSAGIQALTKFDSETNQLMAGAQQGALSQLGGIAGQFRAAGPDVLREATGLSSLAQGRYGIAQSTGQGLFNARMPKMQAAGAQFVGQQIMAQNQMQQAGAFGQLVAQGVGAYMGGGMGSLAASGGGGAASGGGASSFSMPSNLLGAQG